MLCDSGAEERTTRSYSFCFVSATTAKMIEEGDYVPVKLSGAVKNIMLWKPLNNSTCPFEEQEPTDADMRSAKTGRLTLLFCANTSGDFITKLQLLYRKLCPNLLREKKKSKFLVYLSANRKALMTFSP